MWVSQSMPKFSSGVGVFENVTQLRWWELRFQLIQDTPIHSLELEQDTWRNYVTKKAL